MSQVLILILLPFVFITISSNEESERLEVAELLEPLDFRREKDSTLLAYGSNLELRGRAGRMG